MGRGRAPCCERMEVKRGWWTAEEDGKLVSYIQKYGHQNWRTLPKRAGLQRCGKSCRLRWVNYLRPGIKHGNFTQEEEHAIIELHRILGNQWAKIASSLPGRTDNEIKNIWNTYLRKRTIPQFCDPLLKSPRTENPALSNSFEPQNSCVISPNTLPANPFELPAAMTDNALVIPFDTEFWNEKDDRYTGPTTSACAGMDGSFVIEESERWLLELVEELGLLEEGEGEWMKKEGMAVKEGELVNNFM